jgi:hypothetical protein
MASHRRGTKKQRAQNMGDSLEECERIWGRSVPVACFLPGVFGEEVLNLNEPVRKNLSHKITAR